ncbi:hypothetical protein BHM03_00020174 [Ensete ventricosum]|nr:hypothetical protein BHM03_00020174 [Ensete ventricosum]
MDPTTLNPFSFFYRAGEASKKTKPKRSKRRRLFFGLGFCCPHCFHPLIDVGITSCCFARCSRPTHCLTGKQKKQHHTAQETLLTRSIVRNWYKNPTFRLTFSCFLALLAWFHSALSDCGVLGQEGERSGGQRGRSHFEAWESEEKGDRERMSIYGRDPWGGPLEIHADSATDDDRSRNLDLDRAALSMTSRQLDETQQSWLLAGPGDKGKKKKKYVDLGCLIVSRKIFLWTVGAVVAAAALAGLITLIVKTVPHHHRPRPPPDNYTLALHKALMFFNAQRCESQSLSFPQCV